MAKHPRFDDFISQFTVKRTTGGEYSCICPAHDDKAPSLSISEGERGIVLHCHAGCSTEDVCAAVNWPVNDLFYPDSDQQPDTRPIHKRWDDLKPWEKPTKEKYDYVDADGNLRFQVVRYDVPPGRSKEFAQRHPDKASKSGWRWNMQGVTRIPYNLQNVAKAIAADAYIYIVEGEKDVHNLQAIKCVATCNPGGAGKWLDSYSEYLRGAHVVILPDNDVPGCEHALQVACSVRTVAASVRVIQLPGLPAKGDVSDWLQDHTAEDFVRLVESAPEWVPGMEIAPSPAALAAHKTEGKDSKNLSGDNECYNQQELAQMVAAAQDAVTAVIKADDPPAVFELVEILSAIPPVECEKLRAQLAAHFRRRIRLGGLDAAIRAARTKDTKSENTSKADLLLKLTTEAVVRAFQTPDKIAYASVVYGDTTRTLPVVSTDFRHFLRRLWEAEHGTRSLGGDSIKTVVEHIEAYAHNGGETEEVYNRVAGANGKVYVDLANENWEAVEIDSAGWRVVSTPPVTFRRGRGICELPTPEPGGSLHELRQFVNVNDENWILLIGYIIGTLNPLPPYPILGVYGEQGSGKSTVSRIVKELIDPAVPALRTHPEDAKTVISAALNSWVLAYSNLSGIPPWLSDLLCCLSTDGGFATRTLYETLEETTFDGKRPVIINGIADLINRSDLLDRAIQINLDPIPDTARRDEETYWAEFRTVRPRLLGALYDAVSCALRNKPSVVLTAKPRMADFAKWVVAAEEKLPWPSIGQGSLFLSTYTANREDANRQAIISNPLAGLILDFAKDLELPWEGSAEELFRLLERRSSASVNGILSRPEWFPKTALSLTQKIARLAPNLRGCGCDVKRQRTGAHRTITISYSPPETPGDDLPPGGSGLMTVSSGNDSFNPVDDSFNPGGNSANSRSKPPDHDSLDSNDSYFRDSSVRGKNKINGLEDPYYILTDSPNSCGINRHNCHNCHVESIEPVQAAVSADEILRLAEATGWAQLRYARGKSVGPGEAAWRTFATHGASERAAVLDLMRSNGIVFIDPEGGAE